MLKAAFISFACAVSTVAICSRIDANPVSNGLNLNSNFRVLLTQTQTQSTGASNAGKLFEAAAEIIGNRHNQISSEIMRSGETPGVSFSSNVITETTMEMPNKLNSKITFVSPNGSVGKQYRVIFDGEKAWIYNLATNQYSVGTYQEFIYSKDSFTLGIILNFYFWLQEDLDNGDFTQFINNMSDEELNRYIQTKLNINDGVTISKKTLDDTQYDTYKFNNKLENIDVEILIYEQLNEIKYIFLSGKESKFEIALQEKIISQVSPLVVPKQTFIFSPPDGSEQVSKMIRIDPF